jgi:broad specificity phosphatase PhoE
MTTVHLLRHGEVHNPEGILYGRLPGFRLSALGEAQAIVAAEFLSSRPVVHLVSSPLERAQQTAEPLSAALGLGVEIDERLIEAANRLEGRPVAGGRNLFRDPSNWRLFVNPFRPSWGEPYVEVAARVLAAALAASAAAEAAGGEAVCVTHQLPIVCARRSAEHQRLFHDPRRRQCGLGSVTSLMFEGGSVVHVDYTEPAAGILPEGHGAGA